VGLDALNFCGDVVERQLYSSGSLLGDQAAFDALLLWDRDHRVAFDQRLAGKRPTRIQIVGI